VTLLGAVVPGAGLFWARRRLLGVAVLVVLVALAATALWAVRDLDALLTLAFDADRLRVATAAVTLLLVLWGAAVIATYVLVRPLGMRWPVALVGVLAVALVCLGPAAVSVVAARYASVQVGLVTGVFHNNRTATAPRDVTEEDPWGGRERVSVLLLGGDGSVTREGIRTDTVILLSLDTGAGTDTGTGGAVMFSLPRNLMNAPFPEDSPLHEVYPDGFRGEGDPAAWMLNAVYGQVPILHPGILGTSDNEGADAVKQAVAATLGINVDYYVLVNLDGFRQVVDAMGGVTVNVNAPVAIEGDTDAGIPPVGYLTPGPHQRLDGYHALWFARGRWGSDDYERMLRQRCMVKALIDEARPLRLLRRYESLVETGKEIVRTDIPASLLPAFVKLALEVKDASVRSVAFVSSDQFSPGDPDFDWVRSVVEGALSGSSATPTPTASPTASPSPSGTPAASPTATATEEPDPGAAVEVSDSCAYDPAGW
jgi:LCP family protein required for cell wall assembly